MASKIGNINPDNFEMECILCGNTEKLSTVAHRNHRRIVGFIIACQHCCGKVYGSGFSITLPKPNAPKS